jgi:hypothetical protein
LHTAQASLGQGAHPHVGWNTSLPCGQSLLTWDLYEGAWVACYCTTAFHLNHNQVWCRLKGN